MTFRHTDDGVLVEKVDQQNPFTGQGVSDERTIKEKQNSRIQTEG
jgi:hypothetical protein